MSLLHLSNQLYRCTTRRHGKVSASCPRYCKPILRDLHEFTAKLVQDKSLTQEERLARGRPARMNAHEQMIVLLTEDQKKKGRST